MVCGSSREKNRAPVHTGNPAGRVIYQKNALWQVGNGKNRTVSGFFRNDTETALVRLGLQRALVLTGVGSLHRQIHHIHRLPRQPLPEDEALALREALHPLQQPFRVVTPFHQYDGILDRTAARRLESGFGISLGSWL